MAQYPVRVNLSMIAFPFLSELSGRSIIVKQQDQNYAASVTSSSDLNKDIGIPSLFYCHNVIATGHGYQAIYYKQIYNPIGGVSTVVDIFQVFDSDASGRTYICYDKSGNFYYAQNYVGLKSPNNYWTFCNSIPAAAGKKITTATVNGITYIYIANIGCYKFDFTLLSLVAVTLTGLVAADILGVVGVSGYLIAWTKSVIAWSSLLSPTDFTPSLATGAGGGSVQGARGDIVVCLAHTVGFVVYTNQNAVAASASQNSRYPWNFRELVASGGLSDKNLATYDANTGNHYVYTSSGLQMISLQQAQTTIPELTDFLAGSVFEDFDEDTNTLSVTALSTVMKKRFTLISDRYLIVSYGVTELTHALIYDLVTKRWSKLKFTHVSVFENSLLTIEVSETPRNSIAFMTKSGSVSLVVIDSRESNSSGVVLLGKYQFIRQRTATLQYIDVENVINPDYITCLDLYTLDGKTLLQADPANHIHSGLNCRFFFTVTGVNHSILFKGFFNLASLEVVLVNHGRR